jgi:hypothetical protein
MDVVEPNYTPDPEEEFRTTLETAKSWLEGALSSWAGLSEGRRLEMVAASLLSLNKLEMVLDAEPQGLELSRKGPVHAHRPNLVDLTLEETPEGGSTPMAKVRIVFGDQPLLGSSPFNPGATRDHAAPARATLDALQDYLFDSLRLEDARVLQISDGPFAVVTLRNNSRLLVGSALIQDNLGVAMARATLDAANRFIRARNELEREPAPSH